MSLVLFKAFFVHHAAAHFGHQAFRYALGHMGKVVVQQMMGPLCAYVGGKTAAYFKKGIAFIVAKLMERYESQKAEADAIAEAEAEAEQCEGCSEERRKEIAGDIRKPAVVKSWWSQMASDAVKYGTQEAVAASMYGMGRMKKPSTKGLQKPKAKGHKKTNDGMGRMKKPSAKRLKKPKAKGHKKTPVASLLQFDPGMINPYAIDIDQTVPHFTLPAQCKSDRGYGEKDVLPEWISTIESATTSEYSIGAVGNEVWKGTTAFAFGVYKCWYEKGMDGCWKKGLEDLLTAEVVNHLCGFLTSTNVCPKSWCGGSKWSFLG